MCDYVYYLVSPVFVLLFFSGDSKLLDSATIYLDSSYFESSYFLDAVAILLSFLFGYGLGTAVTRSKPSIADYGSLKTSVPKLLALSRAGLGFLDRSISDKSHRLVGRIVMTQRFLLRSGC